MNGFDNILPRVKLRQQFKEETGDNWENAQGEPDIDYVLWLENKALPIEGVGGWEDVMNEFYIEHDKQISSGEYAGRMILVFRDWLIKNYEVPQRNSHQRKS